MFTRAICLVLFMLGFACFLLLAIGLAFGNVQAFTVIDRWELVGLQMIPVFAMIVGLLGVQES